MSEKEQVLTVEKMMSLPEKDQRFLLGFVAGMVSRQERDEEEKCCGKCTESKEEK